MEILNQSESVGKFGEELKTGIENVSGARLQEMAELVCSYCNQHTPKAEMER